MKLLNVYYDTEHCPATFDFGTYLVSANAVRQLMKEQVESLGGKFLSVEGAENLETEGGYAKEASDDFKKKQEELLAETLKKIDIVICTATIKKK